MSVAVRVLRPSGLEVVLHVPGDDWQELMRRACNEFGAPSRWIGGPEMPDMEKYRNKGR
jgi:hypothetical protein